MLTLPTFRQAFLDGPHRALAAFAEVATRRPAWIIDSVPTARSRRCQITGGVRAVWWLPPPVCPVRGGDRPSATGEGACRPMGTDYERLAARDEELAIMVQRRRRRMDPNAVPGRHRGRRGASESFLKAKWLC